MELETHYMSPKNPGSFSGFETFYRALKKKYPHVKRKEVKKWIMTQKTYTLHKKRVNKFDRNKIIVRGIDDTWQADLVDMKKFSRVNHGNQYLLVCIDVFSKYAWIKPLKRKTGKQIYEALKEIFKNGPKHLQTDDGTEFFNKIVNDFLKEQSVNIYALRSEMKASIVERFNRTIKEKMFRYFTYTNKYKYIDVLDDFVAAYNKSYHRTIKMAPKDVNMDNEKALWDHLYGTDSAIKFNFSVGDKVRISLVKGVFEKGYTPNWSEEVFIVSKTYPRVPPVYQIKDLNGEVLEGIFYEQQLQKIVHDEETELYRIDHIVKTKIDKKGIKYALVRWLGYSSKFDSWLKYDDIKDLLK